MKKLKNIKKKCNVQKKLIKKMKKKSNKLK